MHTRSLLQSQKEMHHEEYLKVDGRIILKLILEKCVTVVWTELIWLRIRTSEHGKKISGSIKC
jgi:hypothetical protein